MDTSQVYMKGRVDTKDDLRKLLIEVRVRVSKVDRTTLLEGQELNNEMQTKFLFEIFSSLIDGV